MPAPKVPSLKGDKVSVDFDAGSRKPATSDEVAARFQVRQLLGEGGMGSVFVAHDRGLGRIVALKRLRDGFESDPSALRRFILEAQVGAQLEHPNIVPLYSFEQAQAGSPAIAMQLLEGTTMADYIAAAGSASKAELSMQGEYSLKERLGRLLGVCEAIHFAHERGVIHRDLKPDNVMLGRFREVYVMDWGLARVMSSAIDLTREAQRGGESQRPPADAGVVNSFATSATIVAPNADSRPGTASDTGTRHGDVMGTAQYMPPEQALGLIDQVGPAADQYALGVMLQELATLVPARSHTSSMQALSEAVLNKLAPAVDSDGKAIDPALAAIISRATRKEPAERYPSVNAFADDLRRFIRDEPVSVYKEGLARRTVRAAARRPVLAMFLLSLCGFLASVAIVGAVVRDAQQTKRQAKALESTRRVLLAVTDRAHVIDVGLSDLAANVEAAAAATLELMDRDPASLPPTPTLPELVPSPNYGGAAVSFDGVVVTWPGAEAGVAQPVTARRLALLERWLREPLINALPENERRAKAELQKEALGLGHSALLRAFVGLEDGTFVQFPAREIAATVDPRHRPWYRMAKQDRELHWTRPILDASKRTLRISALRGLTSRDEFVGVAGCDMRVAALVSKLTLTLPGFRRAYLVTEDAKIAAIEGLEAAMIAQTKDADRDLNLPSVDDEELAARIIKGDAGGYLIKGPRLIVFSRLLSPAWTYVAELDRATYLD
ncbi:MAG TPA: protein kinase [Polyangiaceae bacterium]|nr:protein kinase [Polyangiaceae bacterium]